MSYLKTLFISYYNLILSNFLLRCSTLYKRNTDLIFDFD